MVKLISDIVEDTIVALDAIKTTDLIEPFSFGQVLIFLLIVFIFDLKNR